MLSQPKARWSFEVAVDEHDFLEAGWQRVRPDASFPTFTAARPSAVPGRRPAGLALCPPDAVARWKADLHRFPPYQYRAENCVANRQGELRVPSIKEREVILGFPVDYTRRCLVKSMEGSTTHNDCRLTLLGNSWSIPVVAYLLYCLFRMLGLELATLVERLTPGREQFLSSLLMRPPARQTTKAGSAQQGLSLLRERISCSSWGPISQRDITVCERPSRASSGGGKMWQVGAGREMLSTSTHWSCVRSKQPLSGG